MYEKKVDLYVHLRKLVIQNPGAMLRFTLRVFFFGKKKVSEHLIIRIYEQIVDLCVFLRKLINPWCYAAVRPPVFSAKNFPEI